uniref:Uncharacterized protein n=1 Tax=Anguilla anguilla TaxID=7936 RepID=A0A0E9U603_ANGAN
MTRTTTSRTARETRT